MKIEDKLSIARASIQALKEENAGLWKYIKKLKKGQKTDQLSSSGSVGVRELCDGIIEQYDKNQCWNAIYRTHELMEYLLKRFNKILKSKFFCIFVLTLLLLSSIILT